MKVGACCYSLLLFLAHGFVVHVGKTSPSTGYHYILSSSAALLQDGAATNRGFDSQSHRV